MSDFAVINFFSNMKNTMIILALLSFVTGIFIFMIYRIRFLLMRSWKEKFDFVSKYESPFLFAAHLAAACGIFFFFNTVDLNPDEAGHEWGNYTWLSARLFVGLSLGLLYGEIARVTLRFYYPMIRSRKLMHYRYTPRINPKNGHAMKLFEKKEPKVVYLNEGRSAKENIFSVDYDVWVDSETGDTCIEKYDAYLDVQKCRRCGFQTLKLEKEEIVEEPGRHEVGSLMRYYNCIYCKARKRNLVRLSRPKTACEFFVAPNSIPIEKNNAPALLS